MTFKQKVEEILNETVKNQETDQSEIDEARDHILAAYKEAVEGMPMVEVYGQLGHCAVERQLEACKEHLLKEMGE
jgi:hypothetical protein